MQQAPYPYGQDSECARLIARTDWEKTSLGAMERWPQSLRTSISICVACRFPIIVWWGREMAVLYNDEYIDILGSKHPAAMGRPGQEVWAEVWQVVGPMLESVMRTGCATKSDDLLLNINRYGYEEEAYFSFSYSPIADESGGIGGIFTPVIETTQKVIGQRRLERLRQLGSLPRADGFDDACLSFAALLGDAHVDIPFGAVYRVNEESGGASMLASFGLEGLEEALPRHMAADACQPWPLAKTLQCKRLFLIEDLGELSDKLPRGAWGGRIRQAVVAPVKLPGQDAASALLVAGVSPHCALDESYLSFFGLLADQLQARISEAVSYEAEHKRVEALAEIDRAKTLFFSNVSHEFRTPLTLILGPLEELLRGALPPQLRSQLALMQRNGIRLLKLVNALLDFSRIEAGRMSASFEPVDLAAYTAELASVFRSAIERAGMRLEVDCPALPEPIHVDRAMWEKIVLNLLSNAFKFTFSGVVSVSLGMREGQAELRVRDTGVGIAAQDLPRIFERFQRIEGTRSRSHEGSGIGLALVRDLVQLHGGRIAIDSMPGRGTTVTVMLPTGTAHLPADQLRRGPVRVALDAQREAFLAETELWLSEPPAEPDAVTQAVDLRTIFVVDDNADMLAHLTALLASHYAVRPFPGGEAALQAARQERPDLLISDVMMPLMGGFELLAAFRADRLLAEVPVLLLSARAGEEARIGAARAGADDYLEKPFSARELLAKVDALLLRSRIRTIESEQARRMALTFEQAPAAIALMHGPEHVFELANPLYVDLVGGRQVLGKPLREALPELAGQGIYELLDEVYRSGQPYVGRALRVELQRGAPPALTECHFDFVYQPMRDAAGAVQGIAIVAFEVTEAVRTKRIAEAASRSKDEFMAMLGHELRNPLAPIITALELMKLHGVTAAEKERGIIERQARHLVRLVNDLLDVARVAQGKLRLLKRPVELAEIVHGAVEVASPLLEERRHLLQIDVPAHGLVLHADRERLCQVLANLLTNAAKYSDEGSRILVSARREDAWLVVDVIDNGRGIAPDLLPQIFELFYQDPQSLARSRGGLGLGLAIVRSLTELHGGTVEAYSAGLQCGTRFTLRLPALTTMPDQELPSPRAEPPQAGSAGERYSADILVVDDNTDAAATLKDLLQSLGHEVAVASDGPSALQALDKRRPDMAILDIGLPGMDGYELAARIRNLPEGDRIRLVALTGYGQPSDIEQALAAGFDCHLTKPLSPEALAHLLAAMRGRRAAS